MAPQALSRRTFLGMVLLGAMSAGSFLASCSSGSASSASEEAETQKRSIFVFDTEVYLTAVCPAALMDQAVQRCMYFEGIFSRTVEGSDVWRINHALGEPVEVAPETADCIRTALRYSQETQGLFDITIGAVSSLWDFKEGVKPDDWAIQDALGHVGFKNVLVEGNTVTLTDPLAKIDLGGIAKGYIADDLHSLFAKAGCKSAVLNLGGNVMLVGSKEDGSNWRVGVQDPNDARNVCIARVDCSDKSIVTSGLYERYFQQDGEVYYHILDPRTGYPARTDLLASSVYSNKSCDGDAYATALFIMGKEAALEFIERMQGVEGLVVDENDQVSLSSGAPFVVL